jgi:cytochrome c553
MSGKNDKPRGSVDAWAFAVVSILSGIVVIAFGVGFLILPRFQEQHGASTTTSGAIHNALGFHNHEKLVSSQQEAPRIPTHIVWNESTIHKALSGDAKHGEFVAVNCVACHGEKGMATQTWIPNLAGIDRIVLYKQLEDFRSGTRISGPMSAIAQTLTPEQSVDVAAYYSSLPGMPQSADEHAPMSGRSYRNQDPTARLIFAGDPKRGIAACSVCHGPGAYRLGAPGLSKQNAAYMEQQLHNFAQGVRANDMNMPMRTIAGMLSGEEMHALAAAYSSEAPPKN